MAKKPTSEMTVSQAVDMFTRQIDSLRDSLPVAMFAIQASHRKARRAHEDFLAQRCEKLDRDGRQVFLIPPPLRSPHTALHREVAKTYSAFDIVAGSFLVSLISQYDAFISRLVRALFTLKPEFLNGGDGEVDQKSHKAFTYTDLLKFSSIEDAREQMIDEMIESLLRKSHKEQFIWLENRFGVTLRKDLPAWPLFIEITQRRNLFVHSDGVVSKQYLQKCKEDDVEFASEPSIGEKLSIEPDYFSKAHTTLYEIGIKLSQVLRRKVAPGSLIEADIDLNVIVYELLRSKSYDLAINLSDFACKILKRHADDKMERMMIVNRANAYKLSGDISRANALMAERDWTASAEMFQLAKAAIADDLEMLKKIMVRIGQDSNDVTARSYREWPLFEPVRENPIFAQTFKRVFKEPLILPVQEVGDLSKETDSLTSRGFESDQEKTRPAKKKSAKRTTIH